LNKTFLGIIFIGLVFVSGCSQGDDIILIKKTSSITNNITSNDGNNYTTSIGFNESGTTVQLNLAIYGMPNLTATFTDSEGSGGSISNSSYQCSGTNKLSNVSIINGNITGVCTTDEQGSGTSPTISNVSWKIELDFITSGASSFDPFLGTALSSGTITAASGDNLHIGIIGLRDSTTTNGGYMIRTDVTAFKISGGEKSTFIFRQNTARANLTYRMGFIDTSTFA
jgi:hypothetical protein